MYVYKYISMHACMYVCVQVCMYVCLHVLLYVCMYICGYVYIYCKFDNDIPLAHFCEKLKNKGKEDQKEKKLITTNEKNEIKGK